MEKNRENMKKQYLSEKLRSFLLREGENKTAVPFLHLYRFITEKISMPVTDNLYLYVAAAGSMRLYTPSGIMDYVEGQYSNFRNSFTVEELAEQKNMSVSLFHQKFKSAVGMGPLQCQKRLRLTEARRLMLDENRNATEAAFEVGYESTSQFTRDYRKMFGAAPKEDIMNLKSQLQR